MKIAIALYGQPRNYKGGYENIMQFLRNQTNVDVDFFYHCWTLNPNEQFACSPWRYIDPNSLIYREDTPSILESLYSPISCEYENQSKITFEDSIYKNTLAHRETEKRSSVQSSPNQISNTLFNVYSKNKVRDLIETHVQNTGATYDFVIMTRFDMNTLPNINLHSFDLSKTYVSNCHLPRKLTAEAFIVTPLPVFLKWFNIWRELNVILNDQNLVETVKSFNETLYINSEELVFAIYLLHYKNVDNIDYFQGGNHMI